MPDQPVEGRQQMVRVGAQQGEALGIVGERRLGGLQILPNLMRFLGAHHIDGTDEPVSLVPGRDIFNRNARPVPAISAHAFLRPYSSRLAGGCLRKRVPRSAVAIKP